MSAQQQLIADYVQSIQDVAPAVLKTLVALFTKELRFASRKHFGDSFDPAVGSGGIDRWARRNHLDGTTGRLSILLRPVVRATWELWDQEPKFVGRFFDTPEVPAPEIPAIFFEMPAGLDAIVCVPRNPQDLQAWNRQEWHSKQIIATGPVPKSDAEAEVWLYGFDKGGRHVDGVLRALWQLETAAYNTQRALKATIHHCRRAAELARRNALMAVYFQHRDCTPEKAAQRANVHVETPQHRRKIIEKVLVNLGIEPRDRRLLHPGL